MKKRKKKFNLETKRRETNKQFWEKKRERFSAKPRVNLFIKNEGQTGNMSIASDE